MKRSVTFDSAPPPGTINFGLGQPSVATLPVDMLRRASDAFFAEAEPCDLNYGPLAGDDRFLAALAEFLGRAYGAPVRQETLMVSAGNSQALDLVCLAFARPGDTVLVEDPSYFLAFQVFRDHGLNVVGIPLEGDGIDIDALEQAIVTHEPALLYTIPSYQNPSGVCQSEAKRRRLVELAEQHGVLVVADEVYQLLHYRGSPPQAFGTRIESGQVLSLGSFSKILAPGLRLGWIQAAPERLDTLLAGGMVNSGGSLNHQASHVVRYAMELDLLKPHVDMLRREYGARVDAMDAALQEQFGSIAKWQKPAGGYFFWVRFREHVDVTQHRGRARELESGFQPGGVFSVHDNFQDCMRLSFAYYGGDEIRDGLSRLRRVFSLQPDGAEP